MKLLRLKLDNFRGVGSAEVEFAHQGVTIVEGPNEVGKTSLAEALDLVLHYPDNSSAAAVKAIRPVHLDAGPRVEVELTTGPYHVVYSKRWAKSPGTTLRVLAPVQENKVGREAHDRMQHILAETLDKHLYEALRYQQGMEILQARLKDSVSLSTALDAAASGQAASGAAEENLWERVQQERLRYFTTSGRPVGTRTQLAERVTSLRQHVGQLRAQLDELDDMADRHRRTDTEIVGLELQRETQRLQVQQLTDAWNALHRQEIQVEQHKTAWSDALRHAQEAERAHSARSQIVSTVMAAAVAYEEAATAAARDRPALDAARSAHEVASGERERARELRARAEERASAAREAAEYARQLVSFGLLTARQKRVEATDVERATARAFLDACGVDEKILAAIETAGTAVTKAEARVSAAAPRITIEALADIDLLVGDDRHVLRAAEQMDVPGAADASVTFPHVARIHVSGAASQLQLQETLHQARQSLHGLLSAAGVEVSLGVAEARRLEQARRHAEQQLRNAEQSRQEALNDLTKEELDDYVRRAAERVAAYRLAHPEEACSLCEAAQPDQQDRAETNALGHASEHVERSEQQEQAEIRALAAATERLQACEQVFNQTLEQLRNAENASSEHLMALKVAEQRRCDAEAALELARGTLSDERLAEDLAQSQERASVAKQAWEEAAAALVAADPASLRARLDNARLLGDRLNDTHRDKSLHRERLRTELEVRGERGLHDNWTEAQATLYRAEVEHEQVERRAGAAKLLYDTLARNREAAQRSYVAPFRQEVERLGRIVFGSTFGVDIDHQSLEITSRTLNGITLPFPSLSSGAREQLCVLSRLACARIVSPTDPQGGVPVIIDDALGYSDSDRLERLGAAFSSSAQGCQIIILTCAPQRYQGISGVKVHRLEHSVFAEGLPRVPSLDC